MEEELKRDHAEMQAVIEAKQKIIDAQVRHHTCNTPVTHLRACWRFSLNIRGEVNHLHFN